MTTTPTAQPKRLSHSDYTVAWISPLEVEQIAAVEMLDEEHQSLPQSSRDHNVYKLGRIANHNIVIAGLHNPGNSPAATVVVQMRMTFPNLVFGLLVGIGGGVPRRTSSGWIRLGHVVIGKPNGLDSGIVQYDHGKALAGTIERTGALAPPPVTLLSAAQALAVHRDRALIDPVWQNTMRIPTKRRRLRRFANPGPANDHLYRPDYLHRKLGLSCQECGCDETQRVERDDFQGDDESDLEADAEGFIVVHSGTIASGELVVKDAQLRDSLADKHNVLCFETEAAGALTDFPCMVIRGISDYCDSHKNDIWHGFAAAVAAAYARQLFFHMPFREPFSASPFNTDAMIPTLTRQSSSLNERPDVVDEDERDAVAVTNEGDDSQGPAQVVERLVSDMRLDSANNVPTTDAKDSAGGGEPAGDTDAKFAAWQELWQGFMSQKQPKAAEAVAHSMVNAMEKWYGRESVKYCVSRGRLARALMQQCRYDEAEPMFRDITRVLQRELGRQHEDTIWARLDHGRSLSRQGKHGLARSLLRKIMDERLSVDQDQCARFELGQILCAIRRYDEAEVLFRELSTEQRSHARKGGPSYLNASYWLGKVLFWRDKLEESETTLRETLGGQLSKYGGETTASCRTRCMLGRALCRLNRSTEGFAAIHQALHILTVQLGSDHVESLEVGCGLAKALFDTGYMDHANSNFRQILAIRSRTLGGDNIWTMDALMGYALTLGEVGFYVEAEQNARIVLACRRQVLGHDHPWTLWVMRELGLILSRQGSGRFDEAKSILRETVEASTRALGSTHRETREAVRYLRKVSAADPRLGPRPYKPRKPSHKKYTVQSSPGDAD